MSSLLKEYEAGRLSLSELLNKLRSEAAEEHPEQVEMFLQAVLAARPLATLARLLVWLQQKPELLQLVEHAAEEPVADQMGYGKLWRCSTQALTDLLQLVHNSRSNAKLLVQAAEELVDAGLPQILFGVIWHCGLILAAARQPLCCPAVGEAVRLGRWTPAIVTDESYKTSAGVDWPWAAELLQQLLNYAVAAGLMRALPGGSVAAAAVVISQSSGSIQAGAGGSSSSSDAASNRHLQLVANDIAATAGNVLSIAGSARYSSWGGDNCTAFASSAAAAAATLQLLALRCWQMHQQQQMQQQGQRRLSQQLGRRLRADLLLLPDPQAGPLQQLLPPKVLLEAQESEFAAACTRGHTSAEQECTVLLGQACALATALFRHVGWLSFRNSLVSSKSPALSAAALQLIAELLLRGAAEWQRQYVLLPAEQQQQLATWADEPGRDDGTAAAVQSLLLSAEQRTLLYTEPAAAAAAADAAASCIPQGREQLMAARGLIYECCVLLRIQMSHLWSSGQWQQSFQLLQQGGGQVLLQGLSLAVHCGSLDCHLLMQPGLAAADLFLFVQPAYGSDDAALNTRQELFTSQLARKHPVAFFQFADICARSGQLDATSAQHLLHLVKHGAAKIGTKGLAELLSSSAATAALGSALCSSVKLCISANSAADAGGASNVWPGAVAGCLRDVASALKTAVKHAARESAASDSSSSSSSSSKEQASASALFLAVLISRCLVSLHEVLEEASAIIRGYLHAGIEAFQGVMGVLVLLGGDISTGGNAGSTAAAAGAAATAPAAAGPQLGHDSCSSSSSSSSSSSQAVRWQYLLRLRESRKLAAAAATFHQAWIPEDLAAVCQDIVEGAGDTGLSPAQQQQQQQGAEGAAGAAQRIQQLYEDELTFCRVLAAVAPLPVVCNNPGCVQLRGVSEAAAARHVCAGCGCRYCSASCQAAGWRSHKKGCRRMAACGMRVEGR
uniref:MYND-type domain-containing protein n=1 Tax=Tetradesmus obliquus TaxID=3088 RepID=A0A383VEM1_TETOB|eukprot:jgi/Sobl393_1/16187/SZX63995.1